jgi:hypothetical protein
MTLPETIAVRYTEDEAEYVSLRPVVRQTFQIRELVDMVLSVTGKNADRIAQILRSGAVAYHGYRYWWKGFEAPESELAAILAAFPDSDPSLKFDPAACTAIVIESAETPPRHSLEVKVAVASRRGFLRLQTFWDDLKAYALEKAPVYRDYSYARRADIFWSALAPDDAAQLAAQARRRLPGALQSGIAFFPEATRVVWVCPRQPK